MGLARVGRRIGRHGLVLAAVAVSVLVATAVLSAVAGLAQSAATAGVRQRLAADAGRSVEVSARWSAPGLPAADRAVRTALGRTMAGTPFRTETALRATGGVDLPLPPAGRQRVTDTVLSGLPVALPDPGRHARLRSGSWPDATAASQAGPVSPAGPAAPAVPGSATAGSTTAGSPGPAGPAAPAADGGLRVALPEAAADRLGLDSGGTTFVRDPVTGDPLKLTVTGVYRPDPAAAAVWSGLGGADAAGRALLLVDGAQLTALPAFGDRTLAVWLALPDTDRSSLPGLVALRNRVAAFAGGDTARSVYRGGAPALADTTVRSGLPAAVDGQVVPAVTVRAEIAVPLALLAVLASTVLVLTARGLADAVAEEHELRRSRGAGALRLLAAASLFWAPAAVAAAVGGLLLAEPLLAAVLRGAGVHGLAADGGPTAWWTAGFALSVQLVALLLALARQSWGAGAGARWALRGRRPLRPGVQRAGADLALLAVAVLGFLQLRHHRGVVVMGEGAVFDSGVDPVLVLAPVAMAVAGALLLLRLLPPAGRLLERAAGRARGLVFPLGAWRLSRDAGRQAVAVLVTVLAVACAGLAAGVLAALPAGDRDRAAFTVGADLRLSGVSGVPVQRNTALAALPGVTGLTPVAEQSAFVGSSVVQTVAVDTSAAVASGRLPALRADQADRPAAALLAPLTAVPAQGLAVPGEPTALEVTVRAAADRPLPEGGPSLLLWIRDARGLTDRLAVPLPADGRPHTLTVDLAGSGRRAHPLTLSRLGVEFPRELTRRTTLDLTVPGIGAVTGDRRAALALPPGHAWSRSGAVLATPAALGCPRTGTAPGAAPGRPPGAEPGPPPGFDPTAQYDGGPEDDQAGACTWGSDGADLLHTVLRSHEPLNTMDPAGQATAFAVGPGTGTDVPAPPVLPVLADRALLDAVDAEVGDTVRLDWERGGQNSQQVRITGEIDALPGYDRRDGHLLLDLRALAANRALTGAPPPTDVRWWLTSDDPAATWAAVEGRGGLGRAQSIPQVAAALADDPFRAGLRCAWLLVLATAPLFAVTALTLHSVGAARARRREFAVLRALGVRRAELSATLRAEQVAVTAVPVLLGGLLGLLLAALLLPLTVLDDSAAPVFPALAAAPGRGATVLTAVAVGLLLAPAVLVLTRLLARVDLVRALRAGEDG